MKIATVQCDFLETLLLGPCVYSSCCTSLGQLWGAFEGNLPSFAPSQPVRPHRAFFMTYVRLYLYLQHGLGGHSSSSYSPSMTPHSTYEYTPMQQ